MSEDSAGGARWETEAPAHRLAQLAAAVTELLGNHPDADEDLRGIVVLHDGHGASAAGMLGYSDNPDAYQITDFVKFAGNLFAASGIKMTVRLTRDGEEIPLPEYQSPLAESDADQPEAELIISGVAPTEQMKRATTIITSALKAEEILDGSRIVIIMGLDAEHSVVLHHGYGGNLHQVVHTLMAALLQVDEGGSHVMVLPIGHPN